MNIQSIHYFSLEKCLKLHEDICVYNVKQFKGTSKAINCIVNGISLIDKVWTGLSLLKLFFVFTMFIHLYLGLVGRGETYLVHQTPNLSKTNSDTKMQYLQKVKGKDTLCVEKETCCIAH